MPSSLKAVLLDVVESARCERSKSLGREEKKKWQGLHWSKDTLKVTFKLQVSGSGNHKLLRCNRA